VSSLHPTAAALRDILHVLARRFAPARVLIYPTPVQGAAAAPGIVAALELASSRAECDVLILARGGGSLEDLWAFNDERVARAIRACVVPVVTGIGHEIDFTIADFAADARAPTPSAAAESVVPDRRSWVAALGRSAERLEMAMRRELRGAASRLDTALQRLSLAHPGVRLAQQQQRLDDLEQRIATRCVRNCTTSAVAWAMSLPASCAILRTAWCATCGCAMSSLPDACGMRSWRAWRVPSIA
jgi:exodeoxyribonuclease VII large subunit